MYTYTHIIYRSVLENESPEHSRRLEQEHKWHTRKKKVSVPHKKEISTGN